MPAFVSRDTEHLASFETNVELEQALLVDNGSVACAGSLIHPEYVLMTAYCVEMYVKVVILMPVF